jgi:ascorbate-specific PTS system EIIC-type component UlaA
LITAVLFLGIMGGVGCAVMFEQFRPTFYTIKQIEEGMSIPVLGSVSMSWAREDLKQRRLGMVTYVIMSIALIGMYVLVMLNKDSMALLSRFVTTPG